MAVVEDADEDGAADFSDFKGDHEDEAEESEAGGGVAQVAEADKGVGIANHEAGVAKADEGDEQADAAGDGGVKLVRDGAENHLPDAGGGERKKDDAGEKDCAQGCLPGDVHLEADGVSEVGVEAHAGGERDGIAGDDAHEDGAECGGEAGGCGDGGQGHAGSRTGWLD